VPVVVAPAALPNGVVGTDYSQTISASGPPRTREGTRLPVQSQFLCGHATG